MKFVFRFAMAAALLVSSSVAVKADDIVETAVAAGKFKTLAAALTAADLIPALQGDGPFTVFAPTDEAFAKLPKETIAALLKAENKDQLTAILTFHVVPGKVMAKDVVKVSGAKSLNGQRIDVSVSDKGVMVDNAKVVATDIKCDNGVIHVIDSVILPADKNLAETAVAAGKFGTLVAAAKAAGLVDALAGDTELTVFAPTDEAFAKLPEGTIKSLLLPENKAKLAAILKYHVVAGRVYSEDAVAAKTANTLEGSPIEISVSDKGAMINQAKLIKTDIDASNGVIHVIDSVILPPAKTSSTKQQLRDAVAKGAELYNNGHHQACADLYRNTLTKLMSTTPGDSRMRHQMTSVLNSAGRETCSMQRAWTLRHGIDKMYASLESAN
ncbi:Immunogenic protein MPT70 precursor [Stieleria bergensis]|uniref:Immunogenic protein MPT70 n=1 Tax=Stieleria bergensis TaxID=2528025 RepID=A0A517SS54_9BACT|nr:Immunogenic protein MPT70 precursor [Planctomycetes bacterium SV_7m_r]